MSARTEALVKAARDERARGLGRPRGADVGRAGEPNPALLAQLRRVTQFAAGTPEPEIVRYSGPVRVPLFLAALLAPWVVIALVVRALFNL